MSKIEIFLFREIGNIKNANKKAKPKRIALAGKPINMPSLKSIALMFHVQKRAFFENVGSYILKVFCKITAINELRQNQ